MSFTTEHKNSYTLVKLNSTQFDDVAVQELQQISSSADSETAENYIIDLALAETMKGAISASLIELHKLVYDANASIVFTNLKEEVWQVMKQNQLHLILNITPTMQEAVDIISMEVLERDLLDEGA